MVPNRVLFKTAALRVISLALLALVLTFSMNGLASAADWSEWGTRLTAEVRNRDTVELRSAEPTVSLLIPSGAWWNSAWGYRSPINVSNGSSVALPTRYTTHLTLDTASMVASGQMLPNCADLRVISDDGTATSELDRLVRDCNSDHTDVAFALGHSVAAGGNENGYYLYYGNPDAGAPPANGDAVYLFFEDWEKGTAHWTSAAGLDPSNPGKMGQSVISSQEAFSPSQSQQFPHKASGGDAFSGLVPVTPGGSYALGCWAKSATGAYLPVGFNPYNANRGSAGDEVWLWTNEWTVGPSWAQRSASFTAGPTTAYIQIKSEWWAEGPGEAPVYLDDLYLRYAVSPEPALTMGGTESNLPLPAISDVSASSPALVGLPVKISARVTAPSGVIDVVILKIVSPDGVDVPMTLASGTTSDGTWEASFTPAQIGSYMYRIAAHTEAELSALSPSQALTVADTQKPVITFVSILDPILVRNTQTLQVQVTDNGRLSSVIVMVDGTSHPMVQSGSDFSYAWQPDRVGTETVQVVATDTANNQSTLDHSFTVQGREADVCTWQGCKAGAVSWSIDDGNNSCKSALETADIRGTYFVSGVVQDWVKDYSAAGHEIASHTVDHPCGTPACTPNCTPDTLYGTSYTQADVDAYRSIELDPNIAAIESKTTKPVLSMAWPCGCTDAVRRDAASHYFLGARGYYDYIAQLTWVEDVNLPTPANIWNLNSAHTYNQSFVDRALSEGKWATITSHGECTGIDYIGSKKDVLYVAPIGEVLKYIKVRDAAQITNYARTGRTITFDAAHNLADFTRQKVDGTLLLPIAFDNPVTLNAHIEDNEDALGVTVNGSAVPFSMMTMNGLHYVIFDTPLNGTQHIAISLSVPGPIISKVTGDASVQLGLALHISADVKPAESTLDSVTLRILSPETADVPMVQSAGSDTWQADFTPVQGGTYAYQIVAHETNGTLTTSATQTATVADTQAPAVTPVSIVNPIPVRNQQTLRVNVTDNGRLSQVTVEVDGASHPMTQNGTQWSYAWRPASVGQVAYRVLAFDTSNNQTTLSGSFTVEAREADVCTWQGCKVGAASFSVDDGNNNCRTELEDAGIRGTYYYNGSTTQDWFATYSAAGHEIGTHTVDHLCYGANCPGGACNATTLWQTAFTQADLEKYRREQLEPNIAAIEAGTDKPVVSMAWPCGATDAMRMTAVGYYFVGARGYSDGCPWVQGVNDPAPSEFWNLSTGHDYSQALIDQAISEGKWATITSHGVCAGIDYIGSKKDVLWVAPIGEVLKYIRVRDAVDITNYARTSHTITFDALHNLQTKQPVALGGQTLLPIVFDNPVTLKAHLQATDGVLGVTVDGQPVQFNVIESGGERYVVFDAAVQQVRHASVSLTSLPTIDTITSDTPVELGSPARVSAHVTVNEGSIGVVTLRVLDPVADDYPMTPVEGQPGIYAASFTPDQIATYHFRVVASTGDNITAQSADQSLTVHDTTAPAVSQVSQTYATIQAGQENVLSAQGLDGGGLATAVLATDEGGTWQDWDWPVSDWWDHAWTHRRLVTVAENASIARPAEIIDLAILGQDYPELASCANELRVTDTARHELPSQVYGETSIDGVVSCHLLFQATLDANASQTYLVYWGNPAASAPVYNTGLSATTNGQIINVRNGYFDLDLNSGAGVVSRVRLPQGSNTDLPVAPANSAYVGWHQVCASGGDANITGANSMCGIAATGLTLQTTIAGPLLREYVFTSVKGPATYQITFRFFANVPYYRYSLQQNGATRAVMNNFWLINGYYSRLGAGKTGVPGAYNGYANAADLVEMVSANAVDVASIDGTDNDGADLGGTEYARPTATGLALVVTTGPRQADIDHTLTQATAAPATATTGNVENAPQGTYDSPQILGSGAAPVTASFRWANQKVAAGTTVHWHIRFCDVSGNCATTPDQAFVVRSAGTPPLPHTFYGSLQFVTGDAAPGAGAVAEAYVPGVATPVATASLLNDGANYRLIVPGDVPGTEAKEGAADGDVVTFRIGGRVMAAQSWQTGQVTTLDFHPPQAHLDVTLGGTGLALDAAGAQDLGADIAGYSFDCDGDGIYEVAGQAGTATAVCSNLETGVQVVGVQATDGQGGQGSAQVRLLSLRPGWNLLSLPSVPTSADASDVLAGLGPHYNLVYAWDSAAQMWHKYDPTAPPYASDLDELDPKQGFWLNITESGPVLWTLAGIPAASTDITLYPGWNLVGYPAAAARGLPDALIQHGLTTADYSLIYAYHAADGLNAWKLYDPQAPSSLTALGPGWGYWVMVTIPAGETRSWTVPYPAP
jgi:peptidoglycan/xylan/chitin deacetylase (PgdA/CDA1 family)